MKTFFVLEFVKRADKRPLADVCIASVPKDLALSALQMVRYRPKAPSCGLVHRRGPLRARVSHRRHERALRRRRDIISSSLIGSLESKLISEGLTPVSTFSGLTDRVSLRSGTIICPFVDYSDETTSTRLIRLCRVFCAPFFFLFNFLSRINFSDLFFFVDLAYFE